MNRLAAALLALTSIAAAQTQGPFANSLQGFPASYVSATDPVYNLTITYSGSVAPSNPSMMLGTENLRRTGIQGNQVGFAVDPNTTAFALLRSGNFTIRHFTGIVGTVGSTTIQGNPVFTFSGPAAPNITAVTVTPLGGGNSRYTINGSTLLGSGSNPTSVYRSAPCNDPPYRTILPGSNASQIQIDLPSCAGAHQVFVSHFISAPVGDSSGVIDLVSRAFTVQPEVLRLTSIDPTSGPMNSEISLRAIGTAFERPTTSTAGLIPGSVLIWRRGTLVTPLATTFISPTELRGVIPQSLMIDPQRGPVEILVENRTPEWCGGAAAFIQSTENCTRSNVRLFTIQSPVLTQIDPNTALSRAATGDPVDINVIGAGFAPNAQVFWRPAAGAAPEELAVLQSPAPTVSLLRARIPARLLTEARLARVFVRNPAPTGATPADTRELEFNVTATLRLERLEPGSLPVGSPATPFTAFGTGFSSTTRIRFSATGTFEREPTGQTVNVQQGTIQFTLGADLLSARRTWDVVAVDGTTRRSEIVKFEVTEGVNVTSISPTRQLAGSGTFRLTVNGSGFTSDAVVLMGNQTYTPAPADRTATRLVVEATAPAAAGRVDVRVRIGPASAQVTSNTQTIEFAPEITSLSPASVRARSGNFQLTIAGRGFQAPPPNPTVTVGGAPATIVGTPTAQSISVTVANERIQNVGNVPVIVRINNVDSEAFNLAVTAGGPTISALVPNQRAAGSGPFTLTINGADLTGATVSFGGQAVEVAPGATPSASSMQVVIPNSLLQTTGVRPVVVTASGASASVSFTVTPPVIPTTSVSSGDATVQPNGNTAASLSLAAAAPVDVTGTLELTFAPAAGVVGLPANYIDPALVFVNGGQRRLDFRVPASQTAALTTSGAPLGAINVGTVAGTITVRVISMNAAGVAQNTGNIAPRTIAVPAGAPTITPNSARLVDSPGNVTGRLTGFAPTRAITSATVTFNIASGVTASGSTTFTVPLEPAFTPWFAPTGGGISHGSRFQLQIPFAVEGSTADITGFTILLTGPGNATSATVTGTR
ncbi:MAG: IPT/TIG domain-containing protein [Bryobacterales bacterium]|nr:IPT/TIG domain-containing protein [Bryobacterales bacterium]